MDVDAACAAAGGCAPALERAAARAGGQLQRLSDALSGSYLAPATMSPLAGLAGDRTVP